MLRIITVLCTLFVLCSSAMAAEPIQALPAAPDADPAKVKLGETLFHDPRLSGDNTISCASCHALNKGGTDQRQFSLGIADQEGDINSPTVYNSGLNFAQFWDGRAKDLTEQVDGPVNNPIEMGSNWSQVVEKISQDKAYQAAFAQLYDKQINKSTISDAIAVYEASLLTPSRFDAYLNGDKTQLNAEELKGYDLFKRYGCAACHNGVNTGGNTYQKMGLVKDYFAARGTPIKKPDLGRYNVTGKEADKYYFKVPTLRNIEYTAPYFHDGSTTSLVSAIQTMGEFQLGQQISEQDAVAIATFLKTLSGTDLPTQETVAK